MLALLIRPMCTEKDESLSDLEIQLEISLVERRIDLGSYLLLSSGLRPASLLCLGIEPDREDILCRRNVPTETTILSASRAS